VSGGSYDYLFASFPEQLSVRLEDIQRMAQRLDALGHKKAAADTQRVVQALQNASRLATKDLREMWRCVEWLDSSDYSAEQVAASARDYERENVRDAVGKAMVRVLGVSAGPAFDRSVDAVSNAACEAAGLPPIIENRPR
jgi:hypothetical protein